MVSTCLNLALVTFTVVIYNQLVVVAECKTRMGKFVYVRKYNTHSNCNDTVHVTSIPVEFHGSHAISVIRFEFNYLLCNPTYKQLFCCVCINKATCMDIKVG